MTLLGTRVGRIPLPESGQHTTCYRCGNTFDRGAQNVIPGAPCRDCRDVLRSEGDRTVWRTPPKKATT